MHAGSKLFEIIPDDFAAGNIRFWQLQDVPFGHITIKAELNGNCVLGATLVRTES